MNIGFTLRERDLIGSARAHCDMGEIDALTGESYDLKQKGANPKIATSWAFSSLVAVLGGQRPLRNASRRFS